LIITYEGRDYEFSLDDITVKQALKIEKHLGGPIADFEKGISEGSVTAMQCLGWLVLYGGSQEPIADTDFKIGKFSKAFSDAVRADAEAAQADRPRPTVAASNGQPPVPVSSPSA
jgi:hypothetical protein